MYYSRCENKRLLLMYARRVSKLLTVIDPSMKSVVRMRERENVYNYGIGVDKIITSIPYLAP